MNHLRGALRDGLGLVFGAARAFQAEKRDKYFGSLNSDRSLYERAGALGRYAEDVYHPTNTNFRYFKEATEESPLQYGVQFDRALGAVVVAFRGTSNLADAYIDLEIIPSELQTRAGSLLVHSGFRSAVAPQVEEIAAQVRQEQKRAGGAPLWVTGHSLGGGYALTLALVLLANVQYRDVLSHGVEVMTFGAPLVVYGEDREAVYETLHQLAESCNQRLYIHNMVHGRDIVPRLLGRGREKLLTFFSMMVDGASNLVDAILEDEKEELKALWRKVRNGSPRANAVAQHYVPLGSFHFLLREGVRTLPLEGGAVGSPTYVAKVKKGLSLKRTLLAAVQDSPLGGLVLDHKITSYREQLEGQLRRLG